MVRWLPFSGLEEHHHLSSQKCVPCNVRGQSLQGFPHTCVSWILIRISDVTNHFKEEKRESLHAILQWDPEITFKLCVLSVSSVCLKIKQTESLVRGWLCWWHCWCRWVMPASRLRCRASVQQTRRQQRCCWLCDATPAASPKSQTCQEKHILCKKSMQDATSFKQ